MVWRTLDARITSNHKNRELSFRCITYSMHRPTNLIKIDVFYRADEIIISLTKKLFGLTVHTITHGFYKANSAYIFYILL